MKVLSSIFKKITAFYRQAYSEISSKYPLIYEGDIYSEKYGILVPVVRVMGSSGYVDATASNFIRTEILKTNIHPDSLFKIKELADIQESGSEVHCHDCNGDIYFKDGEQLNIYKESLTDKELNKIMDITNKLFAANLLVERGKHIGRAISNEILEIKEKKVGRKRASIVSIKKHINSK